MRSVSEEYTLFKLETFITGTTCMRKEKMNYSETSKKAGLKAARRLADWFCNTQTPLHDMFSDSGRVAYHVDCNGVTVPGSQWNCAFAIMGWLGAYKAFDDERYLDCALGAGRFLKSLQVFDPFLEEHYGAIRELTPQTTWCYPRDGLSAAWAFIELYRQTGSKEWLKRAELFGEWLLRKALDEEGWPLGAVQFEAPPKYTYIEDYSSGEYNKVQFSCQGGTLNFLYHLSLATQDKKWVGEPFVTIADHFVNYIQQDSGFYCSIERETKQPPQDDPQKGLHRANDDLGSLGLLCAYKITQDKRYLASIEKFLNAVFTGQREDGSFEQSVACIPIILNVISEAGDIINVPAADSQACEKALHALLNTQETSARLVRTYGGIVEERDAKLPIVVARSSGYALIYLLKELAGIDNYLNV